MDRDRERARRAYERVEAFRTEYENQSGAERVTEDDPARAHPSSPRNVPDAGEPPPVPKPFRRYGAAAHRFPILVRRAGLAQAVAFFATRNATESRRFLGDIAGTVGALNPHFAVASVQTLEQQSRKPGLADYTLLTREVLAVCLWYKRYAVSVLGVTPEEDDDEQPEG